MAAYPEERRRRAELAAQAIHQRCDRIVSGHYVVAERRQGQYLAAPARSSDEESSGRCGKESLDRLPFEGKKARLIVGRTPVIFAVAAVHFCRDRAHRRRVAEGHREL